MTKNMLKMTVNPMRAAMPIQYHFSSGKTSNCFKTATPNLVALSEPCHRIKNLNQDFGVMIMLIIYTHVVTLTNLSIHLEANISFTATEL